MNTASKVIVGVVIVAVVLLSCFALQGAASLGFAAGGGQRSSCTGLLVLSSCNNYSAPPAASAEEPLPPWVLGLMGALALVVLIGETRSRP